MSEHFGTGARILRNLHLIAPCPDPEDREGVWRVSTRLDERLQGQRDLVPLSTGEVVVPALGWWSWSRELVSTGVTLKNAPVTYVRYALLLVASEGLTCVSIPLQDGDVPHANLELKEQALAKTQPINGSSRRYHPPDKLLAFLQSL